MDQRLDADETLEEKLKKNTGKIYLNPKNIDNHNGYFINRKLLWNNKWIKHGGIYPHFILRLFKKNYGKSEEITEEHNC